MADIHDEEIVNWRIDYLEDLEGFRYDSIVKAAPIKFQFVKWAITLSVAIILTVILSYTCSSHYPWFSGMFGNIAAGLIASLLILLYSTNKEKNLSFYDSLLFDLNQIMQKIDRAYNNLYNLRHELTSNRMYHTLEEYDFFATKAYMFQSTMLDIYESVKEADKLGYKGFTLSKDQIETQRRELYEFSNKIALAAAQNEKVSIEEYEREYHKFWNVEFESRRQLHDYVTFVRNSGMIMRYGKTGN